MMEGPEKEARHGKGWMFGRIYCNREDKRIVLKRPRSGFGYTVNFGNKWTWVLSILAVFALVILVRVLF